MGLGQIFSRRHRAGKGGRRPDGFDYAILGSHGSSLRLRFHRGGFLKRAPGVRMDEGHFAGYALPALDGIQQRNEKINKKPARRIPRRAGESQEVSSVIVCRYFRAALSRITLDLSMVFMRIRLAD